MISPEDIREASRHAELEKIAAAMDGPRPDQKLSGEEKMARFREADRRTDGMKEASISIAETLQNLMSRGGLVQWQLPHLDLNRDSWLRAKAYIKGVRAACIIMTDNCNMAMQEFSMITELCSRKPDSIPSKIPGRKPTAVKLHLDEHIVAFDDWIFEYIGLIDRKAEALSGILHTRLESAEAMETVSETPSQDSQLRWYRPMAGGDPRHHHILWFLLLEQEGWLDEINTTLSLIATVLNEEKLMEMRVEGQIYESDLDAEEETDEEVADDGSDSNNSDDDDDNDDDDAGHDDRGRNTPRAVDLEGDENRALRHAILRRCVSRGGHACV